MALPQKRHMDVSWQAVFNPGGATDFFEHGMPGGIDVSTDQFSPSNAWWLSELSRLVYRRDEDETAFPFRGPRRRDFLHRVGLEEHAFFNAGGVQAAFVTPVRHNLPPVGILVFRGTTGTWRNWQSNLSAWQSPWPMGGRVHSGFKRKFMAVWPMIADTLNAWSAPLLYTGHSSGAALATLAAGIHPPRALYTFGSPRVGDSDFTETLQRVRIYRLYNPGDIVTFLPPEAPPFRFCHVGEPIRYRRPSLAERVSVHRSAATHRTDFQSMMRPPQFLAEHAPANYIDRFSPGRAA